MRVYTLHSTEPAEQLLDCFNYENNSRKAIDVFTGLALGLLADGTINSKEAEFLNQWVRANERQLPAPFIQNLSPILTSIASANDIPEKTLHDLKGFLMQAIGHHSEDETCDRVGRASGIIYDNIHPCDVIFSTSIFVLSGNFNNGSKKQLREIIESLGGKQSNGPPTRNTKYVVVGAKGSQQWATSSLGTKIERALELKESGQNVTIISEEIFWEAHQLHSK